MRVLVPDFVTPVGNPVTEYLLLNGDIITRVRNIGLPEIFVTVTVSGHLYGDEDERVPTDVLTDKPLIVA